MKGQVQGAGLAQGRWKDKSVRSGQLNVCLSIKACVREAPVLTATNLLPTDVGRFCVSFRCCGNITHEKWGVASCISKQMMAQSSAIAATPDGELVSPEGTQEGKNTLSGDKA